MSGIYVHIPFCKQKCHYCNFHFSVSIKNKRKLIDALIMEIEIQKDFLEDQTITSLYFGGGTPSILSKEELLYIKDAITKYYSFNEGMEFTIEANPDDLNRAFLEDLKLIGVNRLSVGIQSFIDEELSLMNRAHNSAEAKSCIKTALELGFDDISIDLIFGIPGSDMKSWKSNLNKALEFKVPHFSIYNLTVEDKTALAHFVRKGKVKMIDEALMAEQFDYTHDLLTENEFEHYEISNYSLPGRYAKHNTAYWQGEPYLGLGPSAHSFDGKKRQWNIASNSKYITALEQGSISSDSELLTKTDHYNEFVLTGLRTMWGCNKNRLKAFGSTFENHFLREAQVYIKDSFLSEKGDAFCLTKKGLLFADKISSTLFMVD